MKMCCSLAVVLTVLVFTAGSAFGQSTVPLPSVNLGFTSFVDGGAPAGPGFYFQEYIQYFQSDHNTNNDGDTVGFPAAADLNVLVSLNQLIYQSDQELIAGGKWGMDLIVPLVNLDLSPSTPALVNNGFNLGDILVGPYLQWDPIMGENGPVFMHRIEFQMIFPTGDYSSASLVNAGSNYFSFNPYWSGTVFVTPKWTTTWRLHYLYNAENSDPYTPLGAANSQAGQAMHINFASAYEVIEKQLRIGVNGYYLKQFTDPKIDGVSVAGMREQVLGIGPGVVWHLSQDDHLFFNAYFETLARNRPEGNRYIFRWTHHFKSNDKS